MFSTLAARRLLVAATARRSFVVASRPVFEKKTMMVPTMGDSITEGTIVEWAAEIGQAVQDGDVVALVETDKVTIEIKAEGGGVVTQHFGAVDEVVEVGAKLYELDTEAEGFAATPKTETETTAPPPVKEASTPSPESSSHRTPMIHFLGKEGWEARKSGESTTSTPTNPLAITAILDDRVRHPMYGRPAFSQEEMDALMDGGATVAPDVAYFSSGAKFMEQ